MAFDKRAYNAQYNKSNTKQFTLRLSVAEYEQWQAYLKQKGEGFAPLVKRLIAEEMNRDGWNQGGQGNQD